MSNTIVLNSKFENRKNRMLRIGLSILLTVNLLFLYPIDQNASILLLVLTLIVMIALAKTKIRINDEMISFSIKRFFGLYATVLKVEYAEVLRVDYCHKKKNGVIMLLPGNSGVKNVEITFNLKNGEVLTRKFHESTELIELLIEELSKRVELKIND